MIEYSTHYGGPWDRGNADSYYRRKRNPHYFLGNVNTSEKITNLTDSEIEAYHAGFDWNEKFGDIKNY